MEDNDVQLTDEEIKAAEMLFKQYAGPPSWLLGSIDGMGETNYEPTGPAGNMYVVFGNRTVRKWDNLTPEEQDAWRIKLLSLSIQD